MTGVGHGCDLFEVVHRVDVFDHGKRWIAHGVLVDVVGVEFNLTAYAIGLCTVFTHRFSQLVVHRPSDTLCTAIALLLRIKGPAAKVVLQHDGSTVQQARECSRFTHLHQSALCDGIDEEVVEVIHQTDVTCRQPHAFKHVKVDVGFIKVIDRVAFDGFGSLVKAREHQSSHHIVAVEHQGVVFKDQRPLTHPYVSTGANRHLPHPSA